MNESEIIKDAVKMGMLARNAFLCSEKYCGDKNMSDGDMRIAFQRFGSDIKKEVILDTLLVFARAIAGMEVEKQIVAVALQAAMDSHKTSVDTTGIKPITLTPQMLVDVWDKILSEDKEK